DARKKRTRRLRLCRVQSRKRRVRWKTRQGGSAAADVGVAEADAGGGGLGNIDRRFLVDDARRAAGGRLHLGNDDVADVVPLQVADVVGGESIDLSRGPDLVDDDGVGQALLGELGDLLEVALLSLGRSLDLGSAAGLGVL